jgi:WD40 repeat protein
LVSFSRDGKIVSVSGFLDWSGERYKSNYTVNIWRGDGDYKQLETLSGQGDYDSINSDVDKGLDAFKKVSFSANGKTFALASRDHAINLWNLDGTLQTPLLGHKNWVNSVSFSPDGKHIASGSDDETVKLWSRDGSLLKTIKEHKDKVNSVSFSPDGKMIASTSDDRTVKLWYFNGTPYKLASSIDEHNEKITSVRFSPDSQTLAYASESGTVRLWSISDRKDKDKNGLQKPDNSSITELDALNFSKDGNQLALGGDGMSSTQLYILNDFWFQVTDLYNSTWFSGVSFNPNNESITVTSNDGKLLLSPSLDELLVQGCNWARDYLENKPKEDSDRHLCDGIGTQK